MARIVQFYIPATFRRRHVRWTSSESRGKVVKFRPRQRERYVWLPSGAQWEMPSSTNSRRARG